MNMARWMSSGVLAMLAGSVNAEIINVPGDFGTIQAAIDAAQDGDEVVVAPGTYREFNIDINTGVDITIDRRTKQWAHCE